MAKSVCVIDMEATGKQEFKDQNYEGVFPQGIESCFQKQTRLFVKVENRYPEQDKQIEFVNFCIDNIRCNSQD